MGGSGPEEDDYKKRCTSFHLFSPLSQEPKSKGVKEGARKGSNKGGRGGGARVGGRNKGGREGGGGEGVENTIGFLWKNRLDMVV